MPEEQIPYFEDEQSKLVPGVPIVERNTIIAVVRNPATNEYLCLDWEKFSWRTFIIGGIDENEDPIDAAKREITEETGYTDLKFVKELGKIRSGYYAAHKKENRIANETGLFFELASNAQETTNDAETAHHVYKWIPKAQVDKFVNLSSQKHLWGKVIELSG